MVCLNMMKHNSGLFMYYVNLQFFFHQAVFASVLIGSVSRDGFLECILEGIRTDKRQQLQ